MKKFLVSKKEQDRIQFIKSISGKKIAIYNKKVPELDFFDIKISMKELMNNAIYLERLALSDSNTSIVLIDVMNKNTVYNTLYGRIYSFTETSKAVYIIDTFAFKFDEKQIFRPFLFIDRNILGSSLGEFFNTGIYKDFQDNNIDVYLPKILPYIDIKVNKIKINVVKYKPTKKEIEDYTELKRHLIYDKLYPKTKIVNELIKYVDNTDTKKAVIQANKHKKNLIISNKPKNKFKVYDLLSKSDEITFFSSGVYGADEIELQKTKHALERHNYLIEEYEKLQS